MSLECLKLKQVPLVNAPEIMQWTKTRRHSLRVVELVGCQEVSQDLQNMNAEVWDLIHAPEKSDMKVVINDERPGLARGMYCRWRWTQRLFDWKQNYSPVSPPSHVERHANDDCECEAWRTEPFVLPKRH